MDEDRVEIVRLLAIDTVGPLANVARHEGFRFLDRLIREWNDGDNRFDKPGEVLLGAFDAGVLIGTGGITRQNSTLGRVRRVYVHPAHRRNRVASTLMSRLIEHSRGHFSELVLRTDNPMAATFYERLGFLSEPIDSKDQATHRIFVTKTLGT